MNIAVRRSHKIILLFVACLSVLTGLVTIGMGFVLPQTLSKQLSEMLAVPVHVEKAGINPLTASFWLKGLEVENLPGANERLFLSMESLDINLSFTSLLARKLIFQNITFNKPVIYLEREPNGTFNTTRLRENIQQRFRPRIKIGAQFFFTGYEIYRFQVKQGVLRFVRWTELTTRRKFTFHELNFSFSNFIYPPHRIDPVPTAIYFGAKMEGVHESSIRILGKGNFLSEAPEFNIRSDLKNISLRELNALTLDFPFLITEGLVDLTSVMVPDVDQSDRYLIDNQVTLRDAVLIEKPSQAKVRTFAGRPKKEIIELFERLDSRPFRFGFTVQGNLNDPNFTFSSVFYSQLSIALEAAIQTALDRLNQKSIQTTSFSFQDLMQRLTSFQSREN